ATGQSQEDSSSGETQPLSEENRDNLTSMRPQRAIERDLPYLLAGDHEKRQRDPAYRDQQAHPLQEPGDRESLLEDGKDSFSELPIAPDPKSLPGKGRSER